MSTFLMKNKIHPFPTKHTLSLSSFSGTETRFFFFPRNVQHSSSSFLSPSWLRLPVTGAASTAVHHPPLQRSPPSPHTASHNSSSQTSLSTTFFFSANRLFIAVLNQIMRNL
ncbi:hypothetical protein MtrunA17_Chr6g0487621 [Medicago truncatula]|uniref:Uncharacterized protein n=1 Tax=Medicago truncatula TaxID=3880 RepID=A0A396HKF3_MEDTR|nr:hypothetical protein MtrunA17_Chr6g0487621 [Medicago truncatula]